MDPAIRFRNRYTGQIETEAVYGEAFVRWTYETIPGRVALESLAKRALFSRWFGWRMKRAASHAKIAPFVRDYGIDPAESEQPPETYATFNEFFIRRLKPGARPVADAAAVFPADGRHLGFQDVSRVASIFVKGQKFDIPTLLGDPELARRYANGSAVLSRLCPVDYHRFHFPVAGMPGGTRVVPGPLYSVNPIALRQRISILWTNKRAVTAIETRNLGKVIMLEIGATCVGSIVQTFYPGAPAAKAAEKGYFEFGGSSTLLLFEQGAVRLSDDLVAATDEGLELYARMGDALA